MIVAANDVGDIHQRVIDHDHVVVDRNATGAQDDGIADHLAGELDHAVHDVVEANRMFGNAQANRRSLAAGSSPLRLGGVQHAALSGINGRLLILELLFAVALQLLLRAEAEISFALAYQALGVLAIDRQPVALPIRRVRPTDVWTFVPIQSHPFEIVEQLGFVASLAAFEIRVFDAKHHDAAGLTGEQPVEECSAGVADVQLSGGGWSEANANLRRSAHSVMVTRGRDLRLAESSLSSAD